MHVQLSGNYISFPNRAAALSGIGTFCTFGGCAGSGQRNETGRDFWRAGTLLRVTASSSCKLTLYRYRSETVGKQQEGKRKTAAGRSCKKLMQGMPAPLFVHTKGSCLMMQIYR